jgi:hypothetical protein
MTLRRFVLVALTILLAVPFISSCKRGENDPTFPFTSRDARISAVWTLSSGYYDYLIQENEEFNWVDDDCEDGIGMIAEYQETDVKTISYNFSNSLSHFKHTFTTTRDQFVDGSMVVDGKEYEDALTIERDINFNYELTVRKNGTYRIYITYNLYEDDFLQPSLDGNGKPQYGQTFSGTYEYQDEWHWTDNSNGTKQGIQFDGFPFIALTEDNIGRIYDINGSFKLNYINSVAFTNHNIQFELDKLESKQMTLISNSSFDGYFAEVDEEYEVNIPGQGFMDCQGTYTYRTLENTKYFMSFTSDGKSVDE